MTDSMTFVIVIAGVWLAIGLGLSLVMGRRGHLAFSWLIIGTVLGPLGLVLALDSSRHDEELKPREVAHDIPPPRAGSVDVLAGYDGSPESLAAVDAAARLLGDRLGRLTVATVVPYDGSTTPERLADVALQSFAGNGRTTTQLVTDLKVLHGRPAEALRNGAVDGNYQLIAIGARGAGFSKHVLGSAAYELARGGSVPVLVVGGDDRARTGDPLLARG